MNVLKLTTIEDSPTRYEDLTLTDRQRYWYDYLIRLVEYNNDATNSKLYGSQDSIEDEIFRIKKVIQILRTTHDGRTITSDFDNDRHSKRNSDAECVMLYQK